MRFLSPYKLLVSTAGRDAQLIKDGGPTIAIRVAPVKLSQNEMLSGNYTDLDAKLYMMRDELEAAALAPPSVQDFFVVDGVKKRVTAPAERLYFFEQEHVGYRCFVRG